MVAAGAGRLAVTIKTGDTAMTTSPKQMILNTLADIELHGATADIRSLATGTKHLKSGDAMTFLMKVLQQEDSLVSRKHLAMLKSTILVASIFAK